MIRFNSPFPSTWNRAVIWGASDSDETTIASPQITDICLTTRGREQANSTSVRDSQEVSSIKNIRTRVDPIVSFRMMWIQTVCLLMLFGGVSAQKFLREGFSSQMEGEFKNEMKLGDNQLVSGMTREMFLMQEVDWELQPADFNSIKDGKLRRHLQTYMSEPIKLKLSGRKGKYGLRAMGQLGSGKKLRAYWRQSGQKTQLGASDFLDVSYDEAVKSRLSMLEFEVQLPPVDKKSKKLPSVIFSVAFEPGTMNPKSIVPRGAGTVKVFPVGREADGTTPTLDVGKGHVSLPMRAGIVDSGWARGRAIFRKGRPTGVV